MDPAFDILAEPYRHDRFSKAADKVRQQTRAAQDPNVGLFQD